MTGVLAMLGSEGLRPESTSLWRHLLSLSLGNNLVIVPAALATQKVGGAERRIKLAQDTMKQLGLRTQVAEILSTEQANDHEVNAPLAQADCIYLIGGEPHALCNVLRDSVAWDVIHTRNQAGASLVAAGGAAAALGEQAFVPLNPSPPTLDELTFEPLAGLGLLPGVAVLPYYNWLQSQVIDKIIALSPPLVSLVGIDDQAALITQDDKWEVGGSGTVTITHHQKPPRIFAPGQKISLCQQFG